MRPYAAVLLVLALLSLGLQVQPRSITVEGGPGTDFDQVFTLTNDNPQPITITISPDPYAQYLASSAALSQEMLSIRPYESANIQVRGTVPAFGPETHALRYDVMSTTDDVESFELLLPIDGVAVLRPKIGVDAEDVVESTVVGATVTLYNFGNINAYYNLSLTVRQGDAPMGTVSYPQAVQVLPGGEEKITLLYSEHLSPGDYVLDVSGVVNGVESVEATRPFRVILPDQQRSILPGEDLVLTITRYEDMPRVEYEVTQSGRQILKDAVLVQDDEVTIPTSTLPPGDYRVAVTVTHGRGSDTTRLELEVKERSYIPTGAGWIVALVLVGGIAYTPPVRMRARIVWLSLRMARREKELKRLIDRAHHLAAQA